MAFKTYAQWLKDNHLTSSAANAANWNRQYGPNSPNPDPANAPAAPEAPEAPAAPPPPDPAALEAARVAEARKNIPVFDPNYIDAQGQNDLSGLQTSTDRQKADASRAYSRALAATAAQRPGIERNRAMGIDNTQSHAAARGMFRSGSRIVGEGRVNTDAAEQNSALARQDTQAFEDSDTATTRANEDYTSGRTGIYTQAGARRLDQYRRDNGI
jgi:hypothetical protein